MCELFHKALNLILKVFGSEWLSGFQVATRDLGIRVLQNSRVKRKISGAESLNLYCCRVLGAAGSEHFLRVTVDKVKNPGGLVFNQNAHRRIRSLYVQH